MMVEALTSSDMSLGCTEDGLELVRTRGGSGGVRFYGIVVQSLGVEDTSGVGVSIRQQASSIGKLDSPLCQLHRL
jgi:hypothetical protein